jgi:hypothetical protein
VRLHEVYSEMHFIYFVDSNIRNNCSKPLILESK